jgi:hypothetical protein
MTMTANTRTIVEGGMVAAALAVLSATAAAQGAVPLTKCARDAVVSGTVCVDAYEASVWRVPNPTTTNKKLVTKIQLGDATVNDLTAGGATQLGLLNGPGYAPCERNGQGCVDDIYAVSLPRVIPSSFVSWFQAQAACENSRKRLPTNAEWQAAVNGTPDPGPDDGVTDCNTTYEPADDPTLTGSRASCVSARGAYDMVGNMMEWVAEWVPKSDSLAGSWHPVFSPTGDSQSLVGAATSGEPGAITRGGGFLSQASAGPLAVNAYNVTPTNAGYPQGFRCVR